MVGNISLLLETTGMFQGDKLTLLSEMESGQNPENIQMFTD